MDKATAQEHLQNWLDADMAVATSQAYSIGGRSLTRADSTDIRNQISYWNRVVDSYTTREQGGTPGILMPGFK